MVLEINKINHMLKHRKNPYGVFVNSLDIHNASQLTKQRCDFTLVDFEHNPFDMQAYRHFLMAGVDKRHIYESQSLLMPTTPLVRIPASGRVECDVYVKNALDSGACGIVFPYVETAEQARHCINCMRYAHRSKHQDIRRGFGPKFASWYWGVSMQEHLEMADVWPHNPNGELLAVLQIENQRGINHLDDILQVEGVGAIMIGPADLSIATDGSLNMTRPNMQARIKKILSLTHQHGVARMVLVNPDNYAWYKEQGFEICIAGFDGGMQEGAVKVFRNR